jgi:hypothetical protein
MPPWRGLCQQWQAAASTRLTRNAGQQSVMNVASMTAPAMTAATRARTLEFEHDREVFHRDHRRNAPT